MTATGLTVAPEASPADPLHIVEACGGLPSSAIATALPEARAWHHWRCDRAGSRRWGPPRSFCTSGT